MSKAPKTNVALLGVEGKIWLVMLFFNLVGMTQYAAMKQTHLRIDQDIFNVQVPVSHSRVVHELDRLDQLSTNVATVLFGVRLQFTNVHWRFVCP